MQKNSRKNKMWPLCIAMMGALFSCQDPGSFSGRYEGKIVSSEFLRRGFQQDVTVDMTLSLQSAKRAEGTLTTSDGRFVNSPVGPLGAAAVDILGEVDFPGTNPLILFLSAPTATTGEEATLIVTLGGESGAELRVLYGRDETTGAIYGIFPIQLVSE
jgi:hypothetical protein